MDDASEESMETASAVLSLVEIDEVQGASWLEDTTGLPEGKQLPIRLDMVEHERRQDSIERRVGIGQLLRKAWIELQGGLTTLSLSAGACPGIRVGVDPNNLGRGIQPLGQDGQVACSATDFEDSMTIADSGLTDEFAVDCLDPKQPGKRIVEGKEPIFSRG
jgi:hypothetical protein